MYFGILYTLIICANNTLFFIIRLDHQNILTDITCACEVQLFKFCWDLFFYPYSI